MAIKVLVNGAFGRMGQETVRAVEEDAELELVAKNGRGDDLSSAIKNNQAQVVVDFTLASVGFENTQTIIAAGAHPVIGTSGFTQAQVNELQKICDKKKLGGIIVPNFSIGAVLMMKYAQDAVRYLPHVEIIEMHHDGKQEAPSGTAIKTSEMLAKTKPKTKPKVEEKITLPGARGANNHGITIHSVRLPGLVAHQQVLFGGTGEVLTIRHDMLDRKAAMPGIVLACKKVVNLHSLVYGLENIL